MIDGITKGRNVEVFQTGGLKKTEERANNQPHLISNISMYPDV
jgi:hypothetical protein